MKSLKAIFAFFVPLLAMLITFCIFLLIDNIVDNYKNKIKFSTHNFKKKNQLKNINR